jgi:PAS domain S-box-containing protein
MRNNEQTLLYVDDEEINLTVLKMAFQDVYHVLTAVTPNEALGLIDKHGEIKVIIADLRMPEMSGYELLEKVKAKYPHIVRIVLTGYPDYDIVMQAINNVNVFQYITKPWHKASLLSVLENAFEIYDLRKENLNLVNHLQEQNTLLEKQVENLINLESEARQSESKFRNIFNNSKDAIIITSFERKMLAANVVFCNFFGIEQCEIENYSIQDFFKGENFLIFDQKLEKIKLNDLPSFELFAIDKEGKKVPFELLSKVIDYEYKKAVLTIIRDITERKQEEKKILNAIIETEEKEKQWFAQEMHDGIGPMILTVRLYIEHYFKEKDEKEQQYLSAKIIDLLNETLATTRELSNKLSSLLLYNEGLVKAVRVFCKRIEETSSIRIKIESNLDNNLDTILAASLYRIISELIQNTIKHARANKITIGLTQSPAFVSLHYKDNGIGMEKEKTMNMQKGQGLLNILNRVKSLKGTAHIITTPENGFEMKIVFRNS